ncbi:MAG TPA: hypothetical protein VI298_09195 [Geobacteraceae bacterium]
MLEYLALVLAVILMLFMFRASFYSLFFVILLTTEFYYIQIGGGIARVYHFLAVLVVLLLARHVPLLFSSRVFVALTVFVGVNFCAITLSDAPEKALASFLAFCANVAVAMATALILLAGRVELASFKRVILTVTLVSVLWGLLQIVAFRFAGANLSLSPEQAAQVAAGFGPGFRTEANTFGKYMVFPFLLFLPEYIERSMRHINLIYLVFLVGILMNFTRSSIYGLGIAFIFIIFWYAQTGKLSRFTARGIKVAAAIAVYVALVFAGVVNVSEYAQHKLENLFSQEEILEGSSSGYRLDLMKLVVNNALSDAKKMIIGNGWGQTHLYYNDTKVQAGGGDIVNILGYAGLLGVVAYLVYMLVSFMSARRLAISSQDDQSTRFAEGVMFALVGIFCTGQMTGYLITPEYWILIGICIFLSLNGTNLVRQQMVEG